MSSKDTMNEVTRVGDLYDFYGALLTQRQRQIIEMYHVEDWSLGEISDFLSITRQAVHDQLHRASNQLEMFESALHLFEVARRQRIALANLDGIWARVETAVDADLRSQMTDAIQAVRQTLGGTTGGDSDA